MKDYTLDIWSNEVLLYAGLAFYRDQLELEVVWRDAEAVGLRLPEDETEIILTTERQEPEIDLKVTSADEAVDYIETIGGKVLVSPFDIRIGRCGVVQDPWGNRLILLDTTKGLLLTAEESTILGNAEALKG